MTDEECDAAGKSLWQRELSKPAQIDNVWINASGRDGFAARGWRYFTTINTFNRKLAVTDSG
ncbi:MAG: hypothetical protein ACLR13_10560 [Acutalibacteraceae bacterium]